MAGNQNTLHHRNSKRAEPCFSLMGNMRLHQCPCTLSLPTMARATSFLCQSTIGLAYLSERRAQLILGTFAECGRTFLFHAKELLIALIITPDNVLNRLSIQLLPKTTACLQGWGSWKLVHLGMGRFC